MTRLGRPWPALLLISSAALGASYALGSHNPIREALALWFFLTCPGMAIVGLLDIEDRLAEILIAVALSIALGMLLSLAMAVSHAWTLAGASAVLISLSVLGAAGQVRAARVGRRAPPGDRAASGGPLAAGVRPAADGSEGDGTAPASPVPGL